MSNKLDYIKDAISSGIERVKIVVDGVVTEANAIEALEQFHKTTRARNGYWKYAEPYESIFHDAVIKANGVEKTEEELSSETEETPKKNKKTKNESDES